ncbi:hypothetical protein ASG22_18290 [Chryseobacterium sp. Leaf405]|nr:hypothetical protein ASG22_18290 [Chryseobacterium sp. Leaf405]
MILNNNEIILKEILPRKSFFFNMTEKLRIIFSVFYLAISIFFVINILNSDFGLFPIIGMVIFATAIYITFGRWILKYIKLKNNCYLITNQRIIVAKKGSGKIIKFRELNEINQVTAEMNGNFFGNIIFGEPENIFGKNDEAFSLLKTRGNEFQRG